MRRRAVLPVAIAALTLLLFVRPSDAALNAVDLGNPPGTYVAANGFFPAWYQDTHGLGLDLCLSGANIAPGAVPGGAGGPACTLLANPGIFDPAFAICFPGECTGVPLPPGQTFNFPDESFWFMGDTAFTISGVDVSYGANLEAAFGGGVPATDDQITFARIRIRITLPATAPGGNYTVTHPYGVEVFSVASGGGIKVINTTRDIGITPLFTGALDGDIGPFLRDASLAPGACIPSDVPLECYIGDPNTARPVTGSPFGTNFVRVDGPAGFTSIQGNLFTVMGKVHTGALATPLLVERTTYGRTGTTAQQDVFVQAPPSTSATVTATDANGEAVTMTDSDADGAWYGQSASDPTGTAMTVSLTAGPVSGPNASSSATSPLVDLVTITKAEYDAGTLTVEAVSSDEVTPPTLTVNGQALTLTGTGALQSAAITGLTIPPATVTVTSAQGGSDTEQVDVVNNP
jgi:hypothetical protein